MQSHRVQSHVAGRLLRRIFPRGSEVGASAVRRRADLEATLGWPSATSFCGCLPPCTRSIDTLMGCGWDEEKGAAREFLTRPLQRGGTTFRTERESSPLLEAFPVVDDFTRALDLDRLGWRSMSASPLVAYACSLHASTDFREKLYKIIQNAAKLVAKQPGGGAGQRTAAQVASTLSQSRGIFKLLKWVNCIETYQTSFGEDDPIVRRLKQTEAWLNATVTMMQAPYLLISSALPKS